MSCECGGDRDHELTMGTERVLLRSGFGVSCGFQRAIGYVTMHWLAGCGDTKLVVQIIVFYVDGETQRN